MRTEKRKRFDIEERATPRYFNRKAYNEAAFLAEYYRWLAQRGHELTGNHPITGKPRWKQAYRTPIEREEARRVHVTQARFWLEQAQKLRKYGEV